MIKLKERIKILRESTDSLNTKQITDETLEKYNSNSISNAFLFEFENFLITELVKKLKDEKDPETKKFLIREKRNLAINNLGIKTAIKEISESDFSKQPTVGYMIKNLNNLVNYPEYLIVERFLHTIQPLMWNDLVKKHAEIITSAVKENQEDINLQNSIKLIEDSANDFLMKSFESELDDYIVNRTQPTRTKLIESLEKFKFDYNVQNLLNFLKESNDSFEVFDSQKNLSVNSIYSPVLVEDNKTIFYTGNTFFVKDENKISIMNIEEMKALPVDFVNMCHFLSHDNVKVQENLVTIFSRDKKVEVFLEEEQAKVKVNDDEVTLESFNKIFMNAGIFHRDEANMMNDVYKLTENFDSIFDIDFGKQISSSVIDGHFVNVFNLGENLFVHKVDNRNRINEFKQTSAIETRELVKEFLNFDITESFKSLLTIEEAKVKQLDNNKKELLEAIEYLDVQKVKMEVVLNDEEILVENNTIITDLIEELVLEIEKLKQEYNKIDQNIKNSLEVKEEVKEEVNENLATGDKVKLKNGAIGSVVSVNETDKEAIVLMEDGNTISIPFEKFDEVEIIDKAAVADSEEELRQKSSEAGKSEELEEAKVDYVDAEIKKTGEKVKMDALDYTSKGKREMVGVITEDGKKKEVVKNDLKPTE